MNIESSKARRCRACRNGELQPATYVREFRPHGHHVVVDLLTSRCTSCGAESTRAAQHTENLARLKARKAKYGGLLLGEEILALRRRYGITQQEAAKIFGKGKISFSRYENEVSYPDTTTTNLLKLAIQKPDVIKWLADKAGIELPLWDARCEEERGAKVRVISNIGEADPAALRLARRELSANERRVDFAAVTFPTITERWDTKMVNQSANDDQFQSSDAAFG